MTSLTVTQQIDSIDNLIQLFPKNTEVINFLNNIKDNGVEEDFFDLLANESIKWTTEELLRFFTKETNYIFNALNILPTDNTFYGLYKIAPALYSDEELPKHLKSANWQLVLNDENKGVYTVYYNKTPIISFDYSERTFTPLINVSDLDKHQFIWQIQDILGLNSFQEI